MSSGAVVLIAIVLAVTVMGFLSSRWGGAKLDSIHQWALGGRGFGTLLSWFLMGGDLYTAYTFIALPALVYATGALAFFAIPYSTLAFPLGLVVLTRFWSIAHNRGYVTAADFVRDRFGCRVLEMCIALTGIVAAMPYIALQLVGMKAVFVQVGGTLANGAWGTNGELAIAFILLAAYTFTSGLRAPASIAIVKDTLIYITVIAAVIVIPSKLGGWSHIFGAAATALASRPKPSSILLAPSQSFAYVSMAIGSCMSIFLYPHSITNVVAAKSRAVIANNSALLPIYTILLGLIALLGYCAIAAGIAVPAGETSRIVPMLFAQFFPDWFAGIAYGAVVLGALVPASIMAIGSANILVSNVFKEFSPDRTAGDTRIAKWATVAICAFGLLFVLFLPVPYAIDFQLLGGALMLQIFPAFVLGLWSRWFHPKALILGWFCGIASSVAMAIASGFTSNFTLQLLGFSLTGFIAFYALLLNLAVTILTTLALRAAGAGAGEDRTTAADYA